MNKAVDLGLLIIRLGIGGSVLVFRALGNLVGGSTVWAQNGAFIFETGINVSPELVGLTMAAIETIGALMVISGALFRTGTVLLILTIVPSLIYQMNSASSTVFSGLESSFVSVLLATVLLGLAVSGPGSIAMHPFRRSSDSKGDDPLPTFDNLS